MLIYGSRKRESKTYTYIVDIQSDRRWDCTHILWDTIDNCLRNVYVARRFAEMTTQSATATT